MKPNPPEKLKDYKNYTKAASRSALLPRIFGWLSFLLFVSTVCVLIFLPEKKQFVPSLFLGFFVIFTVYIILKVLKHKLRCSQCQQPLDVIDIQWTPEQWQQIQKYKLIDSFRGADGNLYTAEKEKSRGSTHYFIHAHLQGWYACHHCRLCFLNAPYWRETLFSTIREEEFTQAKQSFLSDPHAREKMKQAYKERLQGR